MENGTQMTLEECMPETFQKPTAGASDSLAKTYPLQESKPDFKEIVQACFSELCEVPAAFSVLLRMPWNCSHSPDNARSN